MPHTISTVSNFRLVLTSQDLRRPTSLRLLPGLILVKSISQGLPASPLRSLMPQAISTASNFPLVLTPQDLRRPGLVLVGLIFQESELLSFVGFFLRAMEILMMDTVSRQAPEGRDLAVRGGRFSLRGRPPSGKTDFRPWVTASEFLASVANGRFRQKPRSAFNFPPSFMRFQWKSAMCLWPS